MEIHQIRYFLALEKSLNFTKAAEDCNVSQPALSRAIAQLEAGLGGELFRRERNLTQLTALGQIVGPQLRLCYDACLRTKSAARDFLKDGHAPLTIVMARTMETQALTPVFGELSKAFPNTEIRVSQNPPHEICEKLKAGDAEVAISGPLESDGERLHSTRLFEQSFGLLLNESHELSERTSITAKDLRGQRIFTRAHCQIHDKISALLKNARVNDVSFQVVPDTDDIDDLVRSDFGIGIWPVNHRVSGNVRVRQIDGAHLVRWMHVHTVTGRPLSPAAAALVDLVRLQDWRGPTSVADRGKELAQ